MKRVVCTVYQYNLLLAKCSNYPPSIYKHNPIDPVLLQNMGKYNDLGLVYR